MRKTEWALTTWANRATAEYVGIDRHINNITIDAFGRRSDKACYYDPIPRRALKVEEGDTVSYVMYDDDSAGNVPVIRITEEEEA